MQKKIRFETHTGVVNGYISANYNNETVTVNGNCPSSHEPTKRSYKCSAIRCFVDNKVVIEYKNFVCTDIQFVQKIQQVEKEFNKFLKKTYAKKSSVVEDFLKDSGYE